jgi:hypothetical protein
MVGDWQAAHLQLDTAVAVVAVVVVAEMKLLCAALWP